MRTGLTGLAGLTVLTLLCSSAHAASHYVRQGATGTGSGADWINAYTSLPSSLTRGDTYYLADGSYGSYTFDDPESGIQVITVKKAIAADHGTDTGWNSTYGDGQIIFTGDLYFARDYYTLNGQTRDESNWSSQTAYGFRVIGGVYSWPLNFAPGGDHLRFSYMDVGGAYSNSYSAGEPGAGFYFVGNGSPVVTDMIVSRCYVHNVGIAIRFETTDQMVIEYSYIGPNWEKEAIRGSGRVTNTTIRYNFFKDSCRGIPGDPTAPGCTANIAIWDGDNYDAGAIYGNVIWETVNIQRSDGCILAGGNPGLVGAVANNYKVYNNTMVGVTGSDCDLRLSTNGTGNVVSNNLWFGLSGGTSSNCIANTCQTNSRVTSNPFVNSAAGDFHLLSATSAGTTLPSPYNMDRDGVTRGADGVWDLGAYEYGSGSPPPPPPPSGSACDLNNDSATNVNDVQLCANQAIGAVSCSAADINQDGVCNVIDVQRVVNAALGGMCVTQ